MSTERILIVDDDASILKVIPRIFTKEGYETVTAGDGFAAIARAREGRFSVAIVDLIMPGMPGLDTIEQLKVIDPDFQVIHLTGRPEIDNPIDQLRNLVFDYILTHAVPPVI